MGLLMAGHAVIMEPVAWRGTPIPDRICEECEKQCMKHASQMHMSVMHVGVMRMLVHERHVPVGVHLRFSAVSREGAPLSS